MPPSPARRPDLAYCNRCPHTGATLEWLPDRLLTADGALIQGGLHGALFPIETGECIRGSCLGQALSPVAVVLDGGKVWLAADWD